jgi:hypothetical protein
MAINNLLRLTYYSNCGARFFTCRPILIGTTSVQESERVLRDLLLGTAVTDEEGNLLFATQRDAIQVLNATPEKVTAVARITSHQGSG